MTTETCISIRNVGMPSELEQVLAIRARVLEDEQGFSHEINEDGRDAYADHVLMVAKGQPVGTARLAMRSADEGTIARIAILQPYRGRGLGRLLIRALEEIARHRRVRTLHIEPHAHLELFFEHLGYRRASAPEKRGSHVLLRMMKKLRGE